MEKRDIVPITIRDTVPFSNAVRGEKDSVDDSDRDAGQATRAKRADAQRNEKTLLDAAAAIFVASGVEAPIRHIAAKAGVGTATIYRHFPTRADLIIAVYRHKVEIGRASCRERVCYVV